MNMPEFKSLKKTFLYVMLCATGCFATSCLDDVPDEHRFTWTGEVIASHLEAHPEKYSKFVTILKKANISKKAESSLFQTLSTYGSYTCFAPTNEAVDAFLEEMTNDPKSEISSPNVEDLNDSIATEIAKNHIIERGCKTSDYSEGDFPQLTMNRRSINFKSNETGALILEGTAKIINLDYETENGIIQTIDKVLNPSDKKIPEQILQHKELNLFGNAVLATGLDSLLNIYEFAPNYEGDVKAGKEVSGQGAAYSPVELKQRYTVLIETDSLFEANNITTLQELEAFAQDFYGKEAAGQYENPKNALYKFIAYHILDRQLSYTGGLGGFILEGYTAQGGANGEFKVEDNLPTNHDRYDYFETMLPYTMVKVTRPFTNETLSGELVINYAQDKGTRLLDPNMEKHINVTILRKEDSGVTNFDPKALNGQLHVINKILVYNEDEMKGNILNERMRWDISSLFPEWTNNGVRWEAPATHKTTWIPEGYSKRLVVNGVVDNTVMVYLRPTNTGLNGYTNYHGDEFLAVGRYDFEYRIPYVPKGDYEIRIGYCVSGLRSITQFYFDNKVCGIPVDLAIDGSDPLLGWFEETATMTADEIREKDKAMRNHGYMKGPASVVLDATAGKNMRASKNAIRKIIGQFSLTEGDHWLRIKNVKDKEKTDGGAYYEFNQDYIEIVPTTIITNQAKPEDQY